MKRQIETLGKLAPTPVATRAEQRGALLRRLGLTVRPLVVHIGEFEVSCGPRIVALGPYA